MSENTPTRIIIFGAGLSATSLIKYILQNSQKYHWEVTLVDRNEDLLRRKSEGYDCTLSTIDITDPALLQAAMDNKNIAISLLPPALHIMIAEACLETDTHLFTASYISPEIEAIRTQIEQKGLVFMTELGADPGIDHLSLVKIISDLKKQGAELCSIKSMTGALVRPEDLKDNKLKYKFTWNPDNVIRAGESGGVYIADHKSHRVEYKDLFADVFPVEFEGLQDLYSYYNRDAVSYLKKYDIENIPDFMRGTLRYQPFLRAWDVLVQTGITLEMMEADTDTQSVGQIMATYLSADSGVLDYLQKEYAERIDSGVKETLTWLDLDSTRVLKMGSMPIYQVLKNHLLPILKLEDGDQDLLIMKHEVVYEKASERKLMEACLKILGKNSNSTAISDTVGLPLAIFTKLFAEGGISLEPGLYIPNIPSIATPILEELEDFGIRFVYRTTNSI